jgi:pentatricopeptide repeat protein
VQVHVERGDWDAAKGCFASLLETGVQPSGTMYSQLLGMCTKLPTLEARRAAVLETWAEMQDRAVAPTVSCWNARLRILLQGDLQWYNRLQDALHEMRAAGLQPHADTFNAVMSAAMGSTDPMTAVNVFNQLVASGLQPDKVSYTTLMVAFGYLGQLDAVTSVFENLDVSGENDIVASNALVAILAEAGRLNDARVVMRDLVPACRQSGRVQELLPSYGGIAEGYRKVKDAESAVSVLRLFTRDGGAPDLRLYEAVLGACVAAGRVDLAKQVFRAMQLGHVTVDVERYQAMVDRCVAVEQRRRTNPETKTNQIVSLERLKFWMGMPNEYYSSGVD